MTDTPTIPEHHARFHGPAWAEHLHRHLHHLEHLAMTQQADVDAITASLSGIHDELATGIQNLEDELASKGVTVDLTALQAVRDALKTQADAVPQPAPPPTP